MLVTIALVLLGTWVAGAIYSIGQGVHILLLIGLMLLLLGFMKARDRALLGARGRRSDSDDARARR
jgi:hypothetical protein